FANYFIKMSIYLLLLTNIQDNAITNVDVGTLIYFTCAIFVGTSRYVALDVAVALFSKQEYSEGTIYTFKQEQQKYSNCFVSDRIYDWYRVFVEDALVVLWLKGA
ncbi:hypothetical protein ACJX0J_034741, partial [Zea mays]